MSNVSALWEQEMRTALQRFRNRWQGANIMMEQEMERSRSKYPSTRYVLYYVRRVQQRIQVRNSKKQTLPYLKIVKNNMYQKSECFESNLWVMVHHGRECTYFVLQ